MNNRRALPPELLDHFSAFVAEQMGLHFPPERWPDLEIALDSAARSFNCADAESCFRWLLSATLTRSQVETLAGHLTIAETYFFREGRVFDSLEHRVLPELIRERAREKRLRIWSAGCASGEEPYSIAMLLDRLLPDPGEWNVTLLATDISPQALKKAADGVYREWSFRGMPAEYKARYFKKVGENRYELDPHIRRQVTFSYLNLAEDSYPSLLSNTNAMDVVCCRNVLIYFLPDRARRVIEKLHHCLLDGGWLAVGQTEVSHLDFARFETVNFPDAILYRKSSGGPEASEEPEPPLGYPLQPQAQPQTLEVLSALTGERPDDPDALVLRARALANQGRLEEAQAGCERAVASDKLNPGYYYLLATIGQERGALDEAVGALRRALFLDPDFALAHFALGNLAERRDRPGEAARHYANAMALLESRPPEEPLPEGEGMTVGSLIMMIGSRLAGGNAV